VSSAASGAKAGSDLCGRSLKDLAFPSAIMESMWQAQSKFSQTVRQYLLMMLALIVVSSILASQHASAMDVDIERFLWKKRLLLILSPERADPLFNSLVNEISSRRGDMEDRDLVIFEILESGASKMNSSELEPQNAASFRERFEIPKMFCKLLHQEPISEKDVKLILVNGQGASLDTVLHNGDQVGLGPAVGGM